MKIAVITAMPEEFKAVATALGGVKEAWKGSIRYAVSATRMHEILLVESGIGSDNAVRGGEFAIANGYGALLISAGFCGGVTPELSVGATVVAKKVLLADHSGFTEVPVEFSHAGLNFIVRESVAGGAVFGGAFVTTASLLSKKRVATLIGGFCNNAVVEMESAVVAMMAGELNIPFLGLRTVSDPAGEELLFRLEDICSRDLRRILPWRVMVAVARRPSMIPQLRRLSVGGKKAASSLTSSMSRLLALLDEAPGR